MFFDCFANCYIVFLKMMEITKNTIMYALLFFFLVITLIWNLHLRMPETLVWFKHMNAK